MRACDGMVDLVTPERVAGWVWDRSHPDERLRVVIRLGERKLAELEAGQPRPDLSSAGIGDGRHTFDVELAEPVEAERVGEIVVELAVGQYRLPVAEQAFSQLTRDCQVNVRNIAKLRSEPPASFAFIRLDSNFDCNLHCVYCHNERSKEQVEADDLATFLHENVLSTNNFQVGCVMEPTLDKRLSDLMLLVAASPAKPKLDFMLQTNGILLHMHDQEKLKAAGLTTLSVSVDAAEPATQKLLRNGTSLDKVVRNLVAFRKTCPDVAVEFITTVTSANVGKTEGLVTLGLDIGVKKFVFREVFYHPDNDIVDHTRMPGLLLAPGAFAEMRERLTSAFGSEVPFVFAENEYLTRSARKMYADSRF